MIFSFETFRKLSPQAGANYQHVAKAEKSRESRGHLYLRWTGQPKPPQVLGQLTVLQSAWWEGTDADGRRRDVGSTTLEPPLGSGPYRIKEFSPGRSIVTSAKDYWGQAVNVNIGRDNFDELRFEYFRDGTVALEAFKADAIDWRTENSAKNWATAYDFPAVADRLVLLEEFPIRTSA